MVRTTAKASLKLRKTHASLGYSLPRHKTRKRSASSDMEINQQMSWHDTEDLPLPRFVETKISNRGYDTCHDICHFPFSA